MGNLLSRKITIVIIIIFILLGLLLAGVFWWFQAKKEKAPPTPARPAVSREEFERAKRESEILDTLKTFTDQAVEGVTVVKETYKKIIKNENEGYAIEMPLGLIIARSIKSSDLHFYQPDEYGNICGDPQCPALISIKTEANPAGLSLEEWSQQEEKVAGYPMFENKEEVLVAGEKAYRIQEETMRTAATYYYFLAKGNKIYRLSLAVSVEPQYRDFLATFRLQ